MNVSKMIRIFSLCVFVIWIFCRPLGTGADPGAKSLFYDPYVADEITASDSDDDATGSRGFRVPASKNSDSDKNTVDGKSEISATASADNNETPAKPKVGDAGPKQKNDKVTGKESDPKHPGRKNNAVERSEAVIAKKENKKPETDTKPKKVKPKPSDSAPSNSEDRYYSKVKPGIMYWIELVSPGAAHAQRVSHDRIFRSGDKIRLHITTNADGYLYVLHAGSTGSATIIPISKDGNAWVTRGADHVIPSKTGWLRFDDNPGEEKLKILFASVKSSDSVINVMKRSSAQPGTESMGQLLDVYNKSRENKNSLISHVESGDKNLVPEEGGMNLPAEDKPASPPVFNIECKPDFETDRAVYDAPANYIVNPAGGNVKEPVAVEISLEHRSKAL